MPRGANRTFGTPRPRGLTVTTDPGNPQATPLHSPSCRMTATITIAEAMRATVASAKMISDIPKG